MASSPYKDKVVKNLSNVDKGASRNKGKENRDLLDKLRNLKDIIRPGDKRFGKSIDELTGEVEKILREKDLEIEKKQSRITELEHRVSILENEIIQLKKRVESIDKVDAGESVNILGTHVAALVLPKDEKIAQRGAFSQMFEYVRKHEKDKTWTLLQQQCGMEWINKHSEAKAELKSSRNDEAHHKKFNLANLRQALGDEIMPHRKQQCEDFVNLLELVDSIIKLGVVVNDILKLPVSAKGYKTLLKIENFCHRDVKHLQDVVLKKTKDKVYNFLKALKCCPTYDIIHSIEQTNGPRLGSLVTDTEKDIVCWVLRDPATLTFEGMNRKLENNEQNRSNREKAMEWNKIRDGKKWTEDHSNGMICLKRLLPNDESVDPLPLKIARLHIPDFLSEELWDAGSDIMDIFERWNSL